MDLNDDWSQDGPEVRGEDDDEEDEFEREMEQELLTRAENARQVSGLGSSSVSDPHPSGSKPKSTGSSSKYDDIYFDSDEEETDQRKMQTNDDLFYDPNMDDDDQKWVDQVRDDYINKDRKRLNSDIKSGKVKPLPNSDAVLNCPACFMLLCLDCQRHDTYENQYRAMFVMNCSVKMNETLKYPLSKAEKKRLSKEQKKNASAMDEEVYHPVNCDQCSTEVGVYDKDEVYHFFNIVASHS